ncbi:hypothetical protein BDL97_04G132300 [Sphagnum fallax]|nr:hypothetical protein BDL97_04G132300 [Sphagnum fallax]
MEQAAANRPAMEASLPNSDIEQTHTGYVAPAYGRNAYGAERQVAYAREGFARDAQSFPPPYVDRSSYPHHDGYPRDGAPKDVEVFHRDSRSMHESMRDDDTGNKKQKGADWWHESQGSEQPSEAPKDMAPTVNSHAAPAVPSFGGIDLPGMLLQSQMLGAECQAGSMEEGECGGSSGGGVGIGEEGDDGDGDGKERPDKEGCAKKKRAEMWQDAEMDALVRAYREVHMKLAAAGKKGKQVFKSATDKWKEVQTLLFNEGVDRQPKEIERKWSNLSTAFKQIADWNKKVGRPNYWELDETLKKEKTKAKELPATFRVQLFDTMAEFLGDRVGTHRSRSPAPSHMTLPGLVCAVNASGGPGVVEVTLPIDKLSLHAPPMDTYQKHVRVVLVSTGSFNPPTYMHLRMFELARDALLNEGYYLLGGYMSPVGDAYDKKGLAPAEHRIKMCQLATQDSPFVMVDPWEAKQSSYQRTLTVLSRVEAAVNSHGFAAQEKVKVMLLCGTDLLQSVTKPGVWLPEQVRALLQEHGVVCICSSGQDTRQLLFEHDILFNNRRQIMIVDELIHNDVSSTKVRRNITRGLSVKYLIADSVINYIKTHQLYTTNPVAHQA